jgi:SAM-dependent methyltransferase
VPLKLDSQFAHYEKLYRESDPAREVASDYAAGLVRMALEAGHTLLGVEPQRHCVDVGCGTGCYTNALAQHGFQSLGFDFSGKAIGRARAKYPQLSFEIRDGRNPEFAEDRKFGLVWCKGFSLFNTDDVVELQAVFSQYLGYVAAGGLLAVLFTTHFGRPTRANEWCSLSDASIRAIGEGAKGKLAFPVYALKPVTMYKLGAFKTVSTIRALSASSRLVSSILGIRAHVLLLATPCSEA